MESAKRASSGAVAETVSKFRSQQFYERKWSPQKQLASSEAETVSKFRNRDG